MSLEPRNLMQMYHKPTGRLVIGIYQKVPMIAYVLGFDGEEDAHFAGESEALWDELETEFDDDYAMVVLEDGDVVSSKECELRK